MGTRIEGLQLLKVTDGDTVRVLLNDVDESLRLTCMDTEESRAGSGKPVTAAGKLATAFAKQLFGADDDGMVPESAGVTVDIEFDSDDPQDEALVIHRDNYGRLLCYLHVGQMNYNLELVGLGYSPYFDKYGRAHAYHREFVEAEAVAQADNLVIWNPETNQGGPTRDYGYLRPWWSLRALAVEDFRQQGVPAGALDVRLDYERVRLAAADGEQLTVFCDLKDGVHKWTGGGALIYAGSQHHKFNLWIPDTDEPAAQRIIRLIERRYAEPGRGFVYVSGTAELYNDKPEIVLTDISQLSDFPPGV
jgi:micrococcal nuclease